MKKRLVSIILTVFLVLSMMPFAAFADNDIVCPACGGEVTKKQYHLVGNYWDFYQCNTCGKWAYLSGVAGLKLFSAGDQAIINAADANAILNFAFNNGHLVPAEKAPSGIGRKDLPGYTDDNGTPSVGKDGTISLSGAYSFLGYSTYGGSSLLDGFTFDCTHSWRTKFDCSTYGNFYTTYSNGSVSVSGHYSSDSSAYSSFSPIMAAYYFVAPHDGYYTVSVPNASAIASVKNYDGSYTNLNRFESAVYISGSHKESSGLFTCSAWTGEKESSNTRYLSYSFSAPPYNFGRCTKKMYFVKGDVELVIYRTYSNFDLRNYPSANVTLKTDTPTWDADVFEDIGSTTINNQNNITINNNTWNGNIYTDNSTNLTYIYPQYTTINEKNETVTNISNNPIIYNNETKQYYTYDSVTNNYYYITYETTPTPTPSPSPAPAPTWTPGGGATRGGGVGRHPSDTDAADWTLHYYILNNRRYDAYYALKRTEVDTKNNIPWIDDKHYISTTQIPIANGEYTISVPNGVYWRVWQWDEASQTLTGVNSSNWHNTINNFLFNATGEYIFEFCKADGSDFNTAKDVTLKLKNDKITEYEPGGALDTEPVTPETQNLIIPKMNSNTFTDEHGTWIASGSSKYSDVFDFFYAFDRSTANFWETNVSHSHLQIEIPDPENYYIDGYIMRISKFTNRYAKEWTLQGSDDGKTWDDLDTQKDQNLSDMQEHKYTLTLRKAYKYYRLNMSNYASSMCSLSHFNLLGYQTKDVVIPSPTPAPTNPPTPTTPPTPGGDNPGGSGSGSGSGDNSWNPFKWLTDLLKDLIEDILKGLWKLLTSIFGFILWLLSLLFKLFPWMPNSGILALCAGVVVVTVIRIIKFITGR